MISRKEKPLEQEWVEEEMGDIFLHNLRARRGKEAQEYLENHGIPYKPGTPSLVGGSGDIRPVLEVEVNGESYRFGGLPRIKAGADKLYESVYK